MAAVDGSNMGSRPMYVSVPAFNRINGTSRCIYKIEVHFESQRPWHIEKTYTDLCKVHHEIQTSQYAHLAVNFPPKHPAGLKFSMALRGKQSAMMAEVDFLKERLQKIEAYLNSLLFEAGPDGVDDVVFLNKFFCAFSTTEGVVGHADLERSMLHTLKACRIPQSVYRQLWSEGFTKETLRTVDRNRWVELGVASGCIEQLELKLGGLRHRSTTPSVSSMSRQSSSSAMMQQQMVMEKPMMQQPMMQPMMQPVMQPVMQQVMQPMMQQPMMQQPMMQQPMMMQPVQTGPPAYGALY